MTTSYFALELLLVIILAGPVHQESTERPFGGPFCYTFTGQKIIRASKALACDGDEDCRAPSPVISLHDLTTTYLMRVDHLAHRIQEVLHALHAVLQRDQPTRSLTSDMQHQHKSSA